MKPSKTPPGFRRIRRDRQIHELVHDSYMARSKPAEPAVRRLDPTVLLRRMQLDDAAVRRAGLDVDQRRHTSCRSVTNRPSWMRRMAAA